MLLVLVGLNLLKTIFRCIALCPIDGVLVLSKETSYYLLYCLVVVVIVLLYSVYLIFT